MPLKDLSAKPDEGSLMLVKQQDLPCNLLWRTSYVKTENFRCCHSLHLKYFFPFRGTSFTNGPYMGCLVLHFSAQLCTLVNRLWYLQGIHVSIAHGYPISIISYYPLFLFIFFTLVTILDQLEMHNISLERYLAHVHAFSWWVTSSHETRWANRCRVQIVYCILLRHCGFCSCIMYSTIFQSCAVQFWAFLYVSCAIHFGDYSWIMYCCRK